MDSLSLVLYVVIFIILCFMLLKIITSRKSLNTPKMTGGLGKPLEQREFEGFLNKRLPIVLKYAQNLDKLREAKERLKTQVEEHPELKESKQKYIDTIESHIETINEKLFGERRKIEYFYNISGVFRYLAYRQIYANKLRKHNVPHSVISIFSYGRSVDTSISFNSKEQTEINYGRIDDPDYARIYMTYCDKYENPIEKFREQVLNTPTSIRTGFVKLIEPENEVIMKERKKDLDAAADNLKSSEFRKMSIAQKEMKRDDYKLIEALVERRIHELGKIYPTLPPVYNFYLDFWEPNRMSLVRHCYDDEKVIEVVKKVIAKFLENSGSYKLRPEDYEDIDNTVAEVVERNKPKYKLPSYFNEGTNKIRDKFMETHRDLL